MKITQVYDMSDAGSIPSIAALRASQAAGSMGQGTQDMTYNTMVEAFAMGCGDSCPSNSTTVPLSADEEAWM